MKACAICSSPAYIYCRKHKDYLCGSRWCTNYHRRGMPVSGSLEELVMSIYEYRGDACEFTAPPSFGDYLMYAVAALAASVLTAVLWLHFRS